MKKSKMPVLFVGHGSPMLALSDDMFTRGLRHIGSKILADFAKPKAILAISAHWYTFETFTQLLEKPRQIYDMTGFPKELYEFKYPVMGCTQLGQRLLDLLSCKNSDDLGIDHGIWTVLCHIFPNADIPVTSLSINRRLDAKEMYLLGKRLSVLRDEGYLILASGNIVHNLRLVDPSISYGSEEAIVFDDTIEHFVKNRCDEKLIDYKKIEHNAYSIPTKDHYVPLLYAFGASEGENPLVFNKGCTLASISMTSYAFGL